MRFLTILSLLIVLSISCKEINSPSENTVTTTKSPFRQVDIEFLHQDSTSIRAIAVTDNALMYAGSGGHYGIYKMNLTDSKTTGAALASVFSETNKGRIDFLGKNPSFRSIASTSEAFFILSIESPALLYKYDKNSDAVSLVYTEDGEKVFYDAMTFWNDQEGIAVGDAVNGCLSVIITRDGGNSWSKLDCKTLPDNLPEEGAFAASDTNIKTIGDETWIATGGSVSRIYYSPNKGKSWSINSVPVAQTRETQGVYSVDFYDENNGIAYGGDYTLPKENTANIAVTKDGGKTWNIAASGTNDGYKSCVQYVPNSNGREIVASGFTGVSYSNDAGATWKQISEAPFLSFRFANDSVAYAGGRNTLAKLTFRR